MPIKWRGRAMELIEKLKILGAAAKYDVCATTAKRFDKGKRPWGKAPSSGICHSFTPDGRCISLFKVLMTNECISDCAYCPNRFDQNIERVSFTPEELSKLFMQFYKRNYVSGLFLSSGIAINRQRTLEDMLKTIEILRYQYKFKGYVHLKVLPGASQEYIEKAVKLSDRLSINAEVPNNDYLQKLSERKNFTDDIVEPMKLINDLSQKRQYITQSTQFIVGAAGEKDKEILATTNQLYQDVGLRRAYFSAFQPVEGTPLEKNSPSRIKREHRLYQADFLLRKYDFEFEDLVFEDDGQLAENLDPKLAMALTNVAKFPLEINKAPYQELLEIPGIGPVSAKRIVSGRQNFSIKNLNQLKNMGVVTKRAAPFITIRGKKVGDIDSLLAKKKYKQLSLF